MSILEVRKVVKQYAAVRAVDELSFEVRRGEIFALLGPNGAGKTTMVRMLLGIIHPDSGTVRWQLDDAAPDRDSSRADPRRLGYLPEERGLHKDVPILRSLIYFGMLRGMEKAAAHAAATRWLERLDLSERSNAKLDSLSKGNQQKVQFAAAVLHRPTVAVLDEPFSGFDPLNQERFLDHILEMRDEGTTVLLSAHQMPLVERAADRILLIDRGKSVLSGTLDEIRKNAQVGRCVLLDLHGDVDPSALTQCPGVLSVEPIDARPTSEDDANAPRPHNGARVRVSLASDGPLNDVLAELTRRVSIVGIQDERPTLHDLYVEAVQRSARREPAQAPESAS